MLQSAMALAVTTPLGRAAWAQQQPKGGGRELQDSVSQVHLSLSATGNTVVTWSTSAPGEAAGQTSALDFAIPRVRHAPIGVDIAAGNITTASKMMLWRGQLWNSAELDLRDNISYAYQCSIGRSETRWGPAFELQTVPHAGRDSPVRLALFGDLAEGGAGPEIVRSVSQRPPVDIMLHLGDIAGNLTDEESRKADRFLRMIQPIASKVPYMTLPGDRDDLDTYRRAFHMPSQGDDSWYSFTLGPVRFVTLDTEGMLSNSLNESRRQLKWLKLELDHACKPDERHRHPWLIVAGHRPLYCSMIHAACLKEAVRLRLLLEPLFRKHHVDLYLSAHLHAYERTYPVFNNTLCKKERRMPRRLESPCASIYVVNGDAGQPLLEYHTPHAKWTAKRRPGKPGFGEMTVHNATHLHYQQLEVSGEVRDDFWVVKEEDFSWTDAEGDEDHNPVLLEENFLEAVWWLSFVLAVITTTLGFIKWIHTDGLKRKDEAVRNLRIELSVLSGNIAPRVLGSAQESQHLVDDGGPADEFGGDTGTTTTPGTTAAENGASTTSSVEDGAV